MTSECKQMRAKTCFNKHFQMQYKELSQIKIDSDIYDNSNKEKALLFI